MDGASALGEKIISHPDVITILSIMIVGILAASVLIVAYTLGRWVAGGQNNFTKVLNQNQMLTERLDKTLTNLNTSVQSLPLAFGEAAKGMTEVFAAKLIYLTKREVDEMGRLTEVINGQSRDQFVKLLDSLNRIDLRLGDLERNKTNTEEVLEDLKSLPQMILDVKAALTALVDRADKSLVQLENKDDQIVKEQIINVTIPQATPSSDNPEPAQ